MRGEGADPGEEQPRGTLTWDGHMPGNRAPITLGSYSLTCTPERPQSWVLPFCWGAAHANVAQEGEGDEAR